MISQPEGGRYLKGPAASVGTVEDNIPQQTWFTDSGHDKRRKVYFTVTISRKRESLHDESPNWIEPRQGFLLRLWSAASPWPLCLGLWPMLWQLASKTGKRVGWIQCVLWSCREFPVCSFCICIIQVYLVDRGLYRSAVRELPQRDQVYFSLENILILLYCCLTLLSASLTKASFETNKVASSSTLHRQHNSHYINHVYPRG